ncbi:hypothetical protein APED_15950 [Acanthopleuribacter pedis]
MKMTCRHCKANLAPEVVFENCTQSWVEQRWAYFICPKCSKAMHLEVKDEFVFVGFLDGGPSSAFIYERGYTVEGLKVFVDGNDLVLHLGNMERRLPRKER